MQIFLLQRWKDEYLTWDERDYGKIATIDESASSIWTPQISLYNSDITYGMVDCHDVDCLIYSKGEANVACVDPCRFVGHCEADFSR